MNNCFSGDIPSVLLIGLVSMEGYIGNYNQNPFVFLPFSLSFIAYSIDGGCTPYIPLQPRFVSHKYQDSDFVQIYSTLFVDHLSPDITPENLLSL